MESVSPRRSLDDVPLVFEVPVFFELSDGSPSWSEHGCGALRQNRRRNASIATAVTPSGLWLASHGLVRFRLQISMLVRVSMADVVQSKSTGLGSSDWPRACCRRGGKGTRKERLYNSPLQQTARPSTALRAAPVRPQLKGIVLSWLWQLRPERVL